MRSGAAPGSVRGNGVDCPTDTARLRRLAVQIATLLPEGRHDAKLVLEYAGELVDFLEPEVVPSPEAVRHLRPVSSGS